MSTKPDKKSNKKLLIIAIATLVALAVFGFIFFKILGGAGKKVEVEESIVLDAEYKNTDGKMIELAKNEEDPARFLDELAAEKKTLSSMFRSQFVTAMQQNLNSSSSTFNVKKILALSI